MKSTNGDTHLRRQPRPPHHQWIVAEFKEAEGIDLSKDRMALQRLREAAEKAKMELSTVMETDINLPFISADNTGPKHLQQRLTRAKFEQLVDDLQKTVGPTRQALTDAGVDPSKIDEVVLVGGSTRIPKVSRSSGAVRQGAAQGVNPTRSWRSVPASGRRARRRSQGPAAARRHPVVARHRDARRGDDGLIQRNTTIPTRKSETFSTAADSQTAVEVHVLQGERQLARDNHSAASSFWAFLPAPRGVPQIEVTFDIDANGMVNVSAKDQGTGKEQKITITASSGLSKDSRSDDA